MKTNYVQYKTKKRSRKRKASEGMTAAILLIAFIITAAGIAFVVLTMGTEFQLELGNVGDEGKDASSSAMQVEGGVVSTYAASEKALAYAFSLKLVLATGQVDLADSSLAVSISVDNSEETYLTMNNTITDLSTAATGAYFSYNSGFYAIKWYDSDNAAGNGGNTLTSNQVLTPNEMARFYIGAASLDTDGAEVADEIIITIYSGVATMKISKSIPVGIIDGVNVI